MNALLILLACVFQCLTSYAQEIGKHPGRVNREIVKRLEAAGAKVRYTGAGIYLDFADADVAREDTNLLGQLIGIESVEFAGRKVNDESLSSLKKLSDLRYLTLSGTSVTDAGLQHVGELPCLIRIGIRESPVTADGLKACLSFPSLQMTHVAKIEASTSELQHVFAEFGRRRLSDPVQHEDQVERSNVCWMTLLRGEVTKNRLLKLKVPDHITYAEFRDTKIHSDEIPYLSRFKDLRMLWFRDVEFEGGPLQIRELKELNYLNISNSNIYRRLEELTDLPKLRRLDLDDCVVTDIELSHVSKVSSLRHLSLRCELTDNVLDQLGKMSSLVSLNLRDTRLRRLSEDALKKLESALPHCEINARTRAR